MVRPSDRANAEAAAFVGSASERVARHTVPMDDEVAALRRRLASEAAEKEACSAALQRVRRALDHHCRLLSEASERVQATSSSQSSGQALSPSDAAPGGDAFMRKVQEATRALDSEVQDALALERSQAAGAVGGLSGSAGGEEEPPGSPMGGYSVLRKSLHESARRCEDLQSDMARQTGANEELVQSLSTARETNKRLHEQLRAQTDELNRLTQFRVSDEERVCALHRRHREDEAAFEQDVQQRLTAIRESAESHLCNMERSLTERIRTTSARLEAVRDDVAQLGGQLKEVDVRSLAAAFEKSFFAPDGGLMAEVSAYCKRQTSRRDEVEATARKLAEQLDSEAEARQLEVAGRAQRQAQLAAEREHVQARCTRKVGHLSARLQALSRMVKSERSVSAEEEKRVGQLVERLTSERDEANAELTDVKRDVVRLESSCSAIVGEIKMREQSIVELRRQVRESDDALAAATSGNGHLRQQMADHAQRAQDVCEAETAAVRCESEQRLAHVKETHTMAMEAAHKQILSMEEVLKERTTEAAQLQEQAHKQCAEVDTLKRELMTHKASYETATSARQKLEQELSDARKEFSKERLGLQASIEQLAPHLAALEVEMRAMNERLTDYKRVSTSQATETASRVGALEDLVRDTQRQLADARSRLAETTDAVARVSADCAEAEQRERETQAELEDQLVRRRREFESERKRLEEQLAIERQSALQSLEQCEQRREAQAASLRQMQEECSAQVMALEGERVAAEEQLRVATEQLKKDHATQQRRIQTLERDLGRVRLFVAESQANVVWINQEREREQREAAAIQDRLQDELKHVSSDLTVVANDEASAKGSLRAAIEQQREQNQRLVKEIEDMKQRALTQETQAGERLKKLQNEFEAQTRSLDTKSRDLMTQDRVRLEALTRENDQLRQMAHEQQHAGAAITSGQRSSTPDAGPARAAGGASGSSGGGRFGMPGRQPSQLESHIQRLQKHTEELRMDLARSGGRTSSLAQPAQRGLGGDSATRAAPVVT